MISLTFNPKELKNLKITQKEMNNFFAPGFERMMNQLFIASKINHEWNKQTGTTQSNMRMKINRNRTSGKIFNTTDVAKFLYYGTKRHFVAPTKKSALSWVQGGQRHFSKGHFVSGIKAEPWIEDNFESRENRFLAMIEKSAIEGMTRKWS